VPNANAQPTNYSLQAQDIPGIVDPSKNAMRLRRIRYSEFVKNLKEPESSDAPMIPIHHMVQQIAQY
jgi:hypothetical protein